MAKNIERVPIEELQFQYLKNLISTGDMSVGRAIYRISIFNEAVAIMRLALKD